LLKASPVAELQMLQNNSYLVIAHFLCSCSSSLLTTPVWNGFYRHFQQATNSDLRRQIGQTILFNPKIWSRVSFENATKIFDGWDLFFQKNSQQYSDLCSVPFMLDLLDTFSRQSTSQDAHLAAISNSIGSVIFAISRQSFSVADAGAILEFCVKQKLSPIVVSLLIWLEKLFQTPGIKPMDFFNCLNVFAPLLFILGDDDVRSELIHIFEFLQERETEKSMSVFIDFIRLIQIEARRQLRIHGTRSSAGLDANQADTGLTFLLVFFCCRAVNVRKYSWTALAEAKPFCVRSPQDLFLAFLVAFEVSNETRVLFREFLRVALDGPDNQTIVCESCTEFTTFLLTYSSVLVFSDMIPLLASILATNFRYLTFAVQLIEAFEKVLQFSLRHAICELAENTIQLLILRSGSDARSLFFLFFEKWFLFQPIYRESHLVLGDVLPVWNRSPLLLDNFFEAWRACNLTEPLKYSYCPRVNPKSEWEDSRVMHLLLQLLALIVREDPKAIPHYAVNILLYYCTLSPFEVQPVSHLISQVLRGCQITQCEPLWLNLKVHHPTLNTNFVTKVTQTTESQPTILLFSKTTKLLFEFSQYPPTFNPEIPRFLQSAFEAFNVSKRNTYIHKNPISVTSESLNYGMSWSNLYQRFINERSPYFAASIQARPRSYKRSSFVDYRFRPILLVPQSSGEKPKIAYEHGHITSTWQAECVKITVQNRQRGMFFVTTNGYHFRKESGGELILSASEVTHIFWRWECHVANSVEFFLSTHRTYLFEFPGETTHAFVQRLGKACLPKNVFVQSHPPAIEFQLQGFTERWLSHAITTFDYVIALNFFSGRTFNNIACYPVFPWILSDYQTPEFDPVRLQLRDFSRPVGAFNEDSLMKAKERSEILPPDSQWLYPTGYSNPIIVCHYLVRLQPFTGIHISLQDGRFDAPDRLFQSIPRSFTMLHTTTGSPRELPPEFFFLPEFLLNLDGHNLGVRTDKADLNSVELPDWSDGPADFIRKHGEVLESDQCGQAIAAWIDLIWGYKQTGEAAVAADNTFDPSMYMSAPIVDHTQISILQLVGQIPCQLFTTPHPVRGKYAPPTIGPFSEILAPTSGIVQFCVEGTNPESFRIFAIDQTGKCFCIRRAQCQPIFQCETVTSHRQFISVAHSEFVCLAFDRMGILSLSPGKKRVIKSAHQVHIGAISCIASSSKYIVTGGSDALVALWLCRKDRIEILAESAVHNETIACVAISDEYGVAVSCSTDGKVSVFRLPNLFFIRSIDLELQGEITPVKIVIGKALGDILVFCESDEKQTILKSFTLNGSVIDTKRWPWLLREVLNVVDHRGRDHFIFLKENGQVELMNMFWSLEKTTESSNPEIRGIALHPDGLYIAMLTVKPAFLLIELMF
jgi:hypothetical protein